MIAATRRGLSSGPSLHFISLVVAHLRFAADKGKEAKVQTGGGVQGALGLSSQSRVCCRTR